MAKDILYMQTWGEVAPALLISRQRSSSSPRLETIVEEERGGVRLPKRVIVVLPILLSLSLYALLPKKEINPLEGELNVNKN
ncbi:hypothetical protein Goarm_008776 [Gossypium armourianum]|uniref:Uncharacterized protein n=1 Tax=Gossypium armourianum TaxID=34283 RepID=A0A7J9JQW9_9ROSI|nr:hypothetical protein [Gossypium armourianum]